MFMNPLCVKFIYTSCIVSENTKNSESTKNLIRQYQVTKSHWGLRESIHSPLAIYSYYATDSMAYNSNQGLY